MKKIFSKMDEDLYLVVARYRNNDRLYIGIENANEELYADITINIPEVTIDEKNEIFLSGDLPNEIKNMLIEKEVIKNIKDSIQYNMGRYVKATIDLDVLKEYDSNGVEDFLENNKTYEDLER